MAWVVKGKVYNVAVIRKSIVAFGVSLATVLGTLFLMVQNIVPDAVAAALASAGALVTGITVFLTKNAPLIDAIDGPDPEDAVA